METPKSKKHTRSRRVEESGALSTATASLTSRAARDIFVRQSPRRRVEESGAVSTDGGSDEFRAARDIFVRQSPTVRQSRTSRTSRTTPHPPRMSDESDSVWATGRDTLSRAARRVEYHCLRAWRPGRQESRSRGGDTSSRSQKKGSLLSHSVGATKERRVDSWLRLYNLSRTVSDQL